MNQILNETINDLRGGIQSWRVILLVTLPAFAAGLGAGLIRL